MTLQIAIIVVLITSLFTTCAWIYYVLTGFAYMFVAITKRKPGIPWNTAATFRHLINRDCYTEQGMRAAERAIFGLFRG